MMFKRTRYQSGSLTRETRKTGPAVWIFRWREQTPEGTVNRKVQVGTVEKYRSKSLALQAVEGLRININKQTFEPKTVKELIEHYTEKELSENSAKAYSTRHVYSSCIKTWILPKWGEYALAEVRTVAVEEWLGSLHDLSPGSKAKVRNIMSAIFEHAIRYDWMIRNPITLVRQSAKRKNIPVVLEVHEIKALLDELKQPFKTMVFVAACTGLRVSELLALQWQDIDTERSQITLQRSIVHQVVSHEMKTEVSKKPIVLDSGLAEVLMDWRSVTPFNQGWDWVFASPEMKGSQPYWPDSAMRKVIHPAAVRAKITKHIGWHTFRRTLATLMVANGESTKVLMEALRHANSRVSLEIYAQAMNPAKRLAQGKVIEMIRTAKVEAS